MKISRSSWHWKVYKWWYEKNNAWPLERKQVNLCPYVRAVLLWTPLAFLFTNWVKLYKWGSGKYISLNMITIPVILYGLPKLAGYLSYNFKFALWISDIIIISAVTLVVIGVYGSEWVEERKRRRGEKSPAKFRQLIRAYVKSIHDKVCPQIEIGD